MIRGVREQRFECIPEYWRKRITICIIYYYELTLLIMTRCDTKSEDKSLTRNFIIHASFLYNP